MTCSATDCVSPARARGLCKAHYQRLRNGKSLDAPWAPPWKAMTPYERVMFKTTRAENGCLLYTGKRRPDGYGVVSVGGNRNIRVTRVVAEHHYGPSDLDVLHSCDTPACVEPTHLRYGSKVENLADARDRDRIARGERHGMAKLTEDDVRAIRTDPRTNVAIAREYGINDGHVSGIRSGKRWAHVTAP